MTSNWQQSASLLTDHARRGTSGPLKKTGKLVLRRERVRALQVKALEGAVGGTIFCGSAVCPTNLGCGGTLNGCLPGRVSRMVITCDSPLGGC